MVPSCLRPLLSLRYDDARAVRRRFDLDARRAREERNERRGIVRLENAGHFLMAQLIALNFDGLAVVAVELPSHLVELTMVEDELALRPCDGGRDIGVHRMTHEARRYHELL